MRPTIKLFFITPAVTLLLIANPTHAVTYTWKDTDGVTAFSDDPTVAPVGAKVEVWAGRSLTHTVSDTGSTETAPEQPPERAMRTVTQGQFAIQLAIELGLGEKPTLREAAEILTAVRITPPLGRWELHEAMTPELTSRLRTLTVAAAQMGWITIKPEQALLGFDTAAALLGVHIPIVRGKQALVPSQPIVEVPPLITVSPPPPPIYSYYTWVPVTGGFLWHDASFDGFFILDGIHLNAHFFNDHHFVFEPYVIQHHFVNHFVDHPAQRGHPVVDHRIEHPVADHPAKQQLADRHASSGRGGDHGRRFTSAAPPVSPGILHRREGPQPRFHSKQRHLSGTPSQKQSIAHQEPGARQAIRHRSPPPPSRPAGHTVRLEPRSRPSHHTTAPAPPSSPRSYSRGSHPTSPASHGSNRGSHGRSFSRGRGIGHSSGH